MNPEFITFDEATLLDAINEKEIIESMKELIINYV